MTKPWWKSKTLWFNALVAGMAAIETAAHLVQPFVPGNIYGWLLLVVTVGNAMLRVLTTQGLGK